MMKDFQSIIDFIRSIYPNRDFIPLHEPFFSGNEKQYVLDCIDSTFVSSVGKYVDRFEEMVCELTGAQHAIATVNGTAALHIALLLAGVKKGDLVITQPLTFIATCNAISYCGADPVFVDVDNKTLGLSAKALELWLYQNCEIDIANENSKNQNSQVCIHKISRRHIKACVPMHTFGHPCEIDKIVEICNKYSIPVVEDAAESIGSYFKNKHTGTFGLMGTLSFNGNKTITTGGGGMIVTNDQAMGNLAKHLTTQAKIKHAWRFEHDYVGYNYRLPNINAALGCAQIEKLDFIVETKREVANLYKAFFHNKDIEFVSEPFHSRSNYWLNSILFEDEDERDNFLQMSVEKNVMTRPAWTLMNKLSMFKDAIAGEIPNAELIAARLVNIPSSVR